MIDCGKGRTVLFVPFFRMLVILLAVTFLVAAATVPACAAESGQGEIVLREDGLLQGSAVSLTAGICTALCGVLLFVIVWKMREM